MIATLIRGPARPDQGAPLTSLWSVMRPLAGILITTFAICAMLLAVLVSQMDQRGARQAQLMVQGAVSTRLSALKAMTRDYGRWDDAVVNLYGALDPRWATRNLSNATNVLVVDQSGRTLFSVGPDGSDGVDARTAMPRDLHHLLRRLPVSAEGARTLDNAVGLTTLFNGVPTLVAAMPIIPYSDRIAAPRGPLRYVILTQAIDQPLLNEWQRSFRLRRMTLARSEAAHGTAASAPLVGSSGQPLAFIVWDPVRPGLDAVRAVLPSLLVTLVALGLCCLFLSLRVLAIVRALSRQNEAVTRSADIAAANLEIARQAQVRAEAAQLRAEGLTLQAESARRAAELCKGSCPRIEPTRVGPQAV